jgi:MFS family permease
VNDVAPLSSNQRLLAVGLVLGVTLVAFETTAVITALPTITDELHGDSLYGVALASYTLADVVALVAGGALADRKGPALPFVLAVMTFIAGLIVAGTATSMAIVVLGRVLQGAGTGGFAPLAYVLVKRAFPERRQATMYAVLSAGWVLPSLVAPFFAGFVTERFGWRWVFLGIIPLAVAVGALASRPMMAYGPVAPDDDGTAVRATTRLMWALAAATGVGAFAIGLRSGNVIVAGAITAAGVAVAIPALRRLLPPGFFSARRGMPAVLSARVLATAAFLGVDSFVPLAADRVHGATPLVQGLVIIGAALSWTLGQALMARRPDVDPRRAVALGFALLIAGTVLVLPVLWPAWPLWATFLSWPVGGLGMGILFNPTSVAAMSYAQGGNEGTVSSQVHLADSLGFSLMGACGGAIVAVADRTSLTLRGALGIEFGLAIACALAGVLAARHVAARVVEPTGAPARSAS